MNDGKFVLTKRREKRSLVVVCSLYFIVTVSYKRIIVDRSGWSFEVISKSRLKNALDGWS